MGRQKIGIPTLAEIKKLQAMRQEIYKGCHMYDKKYQKELKRINDTIKLYAKYGN